MKKILCFLTVLVLCFAMLQYMPIAKAAVSNDYLEFDYDFGMKGDNFNVYYKQSGSMNSTTLSGHGYITWLKVGNTAYKLYFTSSQNEYTVAEANAKVAVTADCPDNNTLKITYKVTNTSNSKFNFSLASCGQMANQGDITPLSSGEGLNLGMFDKKLNLWLTDSGISGYNYSECTDPSDLYDLINAMQTHAFSDKATKDSLYVQGTGKHALVSWYWDGKPLDPGATTEYSILFIYGDELPEVSVTPPDSSDSPTQSETLTSGGSANSAVPKTGDTTPIILCIALAACSGCVLLALRRKAKNAA